MTSNRGPFLQLMIFVLLMLAISIAGTSMMFATPLPAAGNVLIFPQLVAGGGYISYIDLVNVDHSATVTGTLFVYNPDGTPRSIAVDGQTTGSQFSVVIPPGGTVVLSTTAVPGLTVGMAKFVSDFPAAGVVRFVNAGGQVGVPASRLATFLTVPLTTNNGNDTGLAICNSGPVPINITLVYADRTGALMQQVQPPQLNPLAVNGQVAAFAAQFGLTQAANRSDGTILIASTTASGYFSALALLNNNAGQLSTTAVIDGISPADTPRQFVGSYTGSWHNTTFGSTGTIAFSMGLVESTQSMLMRITITGNVFGSPAPPPFLFYAAYDPTASPNIFNTSGSDPVLGNYTFTVDNNLHFTYTATGLTSPNASGFTMTGTFHSDKIVATYTVNLKPSGTAVGNIEVDHTNN